MSSFAFPNIDAAIAQFEGFNQTGSIAQRQNNPGNIMYGPFAVAQGSTGPGTNNIAVFPTAKVGANATDALVTQKVATGASLTDLLNQWSPPTATGNTPAGTQNYIDYVAKQTGLNPLAPISGQSITTTATNTGTTPAAGSSSSGSFIPGISSALPGFDSNGNLTTGITSLDNILSSAGNLGGAIDQLTGTVLPGQSQKPTYAFAGFSWGRVGSFTLGLILIIAGLWQLKGVQNIVIQTGKAGARLAEV